MNASNRYALVNKNTGRLRCTKPTRAAARWSKRPTERIFDTENKRYIR